MTFTSLSHPMTGRQVTHADKHYRIASVHLGDGRLWAWCVARDNPEDQVRLPLHVFGQDY